MSNEANTEPQREQLPEVLFTIVRVEGEVAHTVMTIDGIEHLRFSKDAPMRPFHASVETYLRNYFEINGLAYPEEEPWWFSLLGSLGLASNQD
ncbi:hypothetical protein D3C72_329040 [compost metagenome]